MPKGLHNLHQTSLALSLAVSPVILNSFILLDILLHLICTFITNLSLGWMYGSAMSYIKYSGIWRTKVFRNPNIPNIYLCPSFVHFVIIFYKSSFPSRLIKGSWLLDLLLGLFHNYHNSDLLTERSKAGRKTMKTDSICGSISWLVPCIIYYHIHTRLSKISIEWDRFDECMQITCFI